MAEPQPLDQETLAAILQQVSQPCKQEMDEQLGGDGSGEISETCRAEISTVMQRYMSANTQGGPASTAGVDAIPLETEEEPAGAMAGLIVLAVILLAVVGVAAFVVYTNAELQKAGFYKENKKKLSKKKLAKMNKKRN
mmetsp:Transcript_22988/g.29844  ORF Transcript_22988/g.29844 Transcript_22988/m.29844 type:complete len:138 (-) Transcript_22988:307-720(-)